MSYSFRLSDRAKKDFVKLDKQTQRHIQKFINEKIIAQSDPKTFAKPLVRNLKGLWKYRIGNYRIICNIDDDVFEILAVQIGHRRYIYE